MKNTTRSFIAGILVTLSVLGVIGAAAAASQQTATLDYADIKITLDGQTVTPHRCQRHRRGALCHQRHHLSACPGCGQRSGPGGHLGQAPPPR